MKPASLWPPYLQGASFRCLHTETLDEVRHRIVTYAVVALPPTTKSPPEGLPQEIKLRRPDLGLIIALVTTEAKLMAELFHTTGRPWDCLKCSVYIQRETMKWIHVPPVSGSLVINVGDALQIMSNGRYKSVEHRVTANGSNNRIS
ncbi:feruloyl CoA ortho-hydroxylase 1-like protein, partial [Tanacetum coccineum]